jgi:hypothetical protein
MQHKNTKPQTEISNQPQIWQKKLQTNKNMELYYVQLGSKDIRSLSQMLCKKNLSFPMQWK